MVLFALPANGYTYHRVDAVADTAFLSDLYSFKNIANLSGCIIIWLQFTAIFHRRAEI